MSYVPYYDTHLFAIFYGEDLVMLLCSPCVSAFLFSSKLSSELCDSMFVVAGNGSRFRLTLLALLNFQAPAPFASESLLQFPSYLPGLYIRVYLHQYIRW